MVRWHWLLGFLALAIACLLSALRYRAARQDASARATVALFQALKGRNHAAIEQALGQGADPNAAEADVHRQTPLTVAARRCDVTAARLLMNWGARVDSCDGSGQTALMMAAFSDDVDMLRLLLYRGAAINAKDSYGMTALEKAYQFYWGQAADRAFEYLLRRGADLYAPGRDGNSAIARAVTDNRVSVVRLLLKHGADPSVRDISGRSLLQAARSNGERGKETARLLETSLRL